MTEHESIQAMLALTAADALDPGELRRVQQHADGCEICRLELQAWSLHENLVLAALVVFGWAASLTTWTVVRVLTRGELYVLGANLVSGVTWSLLSTALVWMTAAVAAAMLGRRSEFKEAL